MSIILLVAILIFGGGYLLVNQSDQNQSETAANKAQEQQAVENYIASQQPAQEYTDSELINEQGAYLAYSPELVGRKPAENTVLFFNASWCPTCQIAKQNFSENANNIPTGLTILDVDFDDNEDLRKRYGVTTQHTYVQVDAQGGMLKKWVGSYVIDQLLGQIDS